MAINPAIAALLQQKLAAQAGAPAPGAPAPDAPVAPPGIDPASAALAGPPPFPSTDPNAVAGLLNPLEQAQQADQAQLADQQSQAAQVAMQDMLTKLAARPNPDAWAATGGPGTPVSAPPPVAQTGVPSGPAY